MKFFVEFEIHEYMDERPEQQIRLMDAPSKEAVTGIAMAFADGMNKTYSGGTTRFIKVMSMGDALRWMLKDVAETANLCPKDLSYRIPELVKYFLQAFDRGPIDDTTEYLNTLSDEEYNRLFHE